MTLKRSRIFLFNWTLAVVATVCAFVVHLAMRGRTVSLGYELGKARNEQMRLREVKRVLELESASYKTPERVEMVSRSLLGMDPPAPERIVTMGGKLPSFDERNEARAQAKPGQ
jgi:cell division protein FtsL